MTEAEARKANFIDSEMQERYYRNGEKFTVEDVEYAYDSGVAEGRREGFDEGYKKATKRAYERQQDLTDTYIKDGERIKELGKENAELKHEIDELRIKLNAWEYGSPIKELGKENAELKEYVSRAGYRIAELKHEIDELIEKLKGFESGEVAWQGDMDATIKQNLELKEQIEMIRKFFNVNEMKKFAAYVMYYTANPDSTMCIPNCVYEKVDEMYNAWFKKCDTCNYQKTCGMCSVFEEAKNKDRNAICGEWKLVE